MLDLYLSSDIKYLHMILDRMGTSPRMSLVAPASLMKSKDYAHEIF